VRSLISGAVFGFGRNQAAGSLLVFIVDIAIIIVVVSMNMNIRLDGIPENIVLGAIKSGLAKTKTDAILMGLMELDNKYSLLERIEDEEDVREAKRILAEIKSGKQKLISLEEFQRRTGMRLK
jgi:hypothetical protein